MLKKKMKKKSVYTSINTKLDKYITICGYNRRMKFSNSTLRLKWGKNGEKIVLNYR